MKKCLSQFLQWNWSPIQARALDRKYRSMCINIVSDNVERPSRFKEVTEEKLSALKCNADGTAWV